MPVDNFGAQIKADAKPGNMPGVTGLDTVITVKYSFYIFSPDPHSLIFNADNNLPIGDDAPDGDSGSVC